jgi:LytS/YehU family sensor histidine kinase
MEQKWETEKKLTELQFNTIRNQLNPHFIFNALNSVGYLIENGKKDEAYNYLTINSRLIRKVLEDADLTVRPLADEIKFAKDYLAIQEFRFRERFETVFLIDKNVNLKLAVPKMVLHTYVENAIKHAFKNMHSGGKLEIEVNSIPKGVQLKVRDNGIKNKKAAPGESTGKGISIMESYYRIFEKQHQCNIRTSFSKLKETNPLLQGTEVTIQIEYKSF